MRKGLLLCALLSALVGCENLSDTLTDDLTTTLTFYDENEAELVACPYQIGTVLPADSLPTKFPEKKGYLVGGWRFYQKETNAAYDVPTNVTNDKEGIVTSVTVTSVPLSFQVVWWKPITYTIVFDGNGVKTSDERVSHAEKYSYSDGGPTLWKNAFERNGYDFNGWNVAENRGETRHDYTDGETLDYHLADEEGAEVTLYACWLKKEITITFGAGEGSGAMEAATLKVGDPLPACGFAAPEGKRFAGWQWADRSFADAETLTEDNYPNENAAFVAQWDWKTVAVTFDPNGGDGGSDTQEFKWGQPQSLPKSNRYGYDFVGWNTNQDGTGTAYANGETYSFKDNTTLYAQWKLRFEMTEKSSEVEFNQAADCFMFTAPSGSAYQWMLRSGDTAALKSTGSTCTIAYSEYDNKPGAYTLIVTVFDESGIPTQTCWAKFQVNSPQSP